MRRPSLTTDGQVTVLLLLGFAAGAVNTGTNLLFAVLGLIGSLLLVELFRTRRALAGVAAERIVPRTTVRGAPVRGRIRLSAKGGRKLPLLCEELDEEQALDREARVLVWGIAANAPSEAAWEAAFRRRGVARLSGLSLLCRGPCGLFETRAQLPLPSEVLVLPRLRQLKPTPLLAPAPASERRPRAVPLGPERRDVVRTLRELRWGDDPRTIHWRASARKGELVVKEFERGGPEGALVIVDLATPRAGDEGEVQEVEEAAVELALALVTELQRRGEATGLGVAGAGAPVLLAPNAGPGVAAQAREALARARSAPSPDLGRLLRLAGRHGREQRLFLVTTRDPALSRASASVLGAARTFEVRTAAQAESWLVPGEQPEEAGAEAERELLEAGA